MEKTPQSNRLHVTIFGETNSGKSALFNAVLGVSSAIVSDVSGTTTDPVSRSMELLPFGPIVLTDTAGLNDKSILGQERIAKTRKVIERTDFAIYLIDIESFDKNEFNAIKRELDKRETPFLAVFTKADLYGREKLEAYAADYENSYVLSAYDNWDIEGFKLYLSEKLTELMKMSDREQSLIYGILEEGDVVILVVPIDSEAPKGRLILPQVQLIRNCLDGGVRCNVTTVEHLKQALDETKRVDLVVTDSQVFGEAAEIVPQEIKLTSFSILMARQKGDINLLIEGVNAVRSLKDGDKVLMAEVCVHSHGHEDIGQVKIPSLLRKITGRNLQIDFMSGRDYPENIKDYSLIVHCGGCMITKKEMGNRLSFAKENGVAITNYGVILAYASGVLERVGADLRVRPTAIAEE